MSQVNNFQSASEEHIVLSSQNGAVACGENSNGRSWYVMRYKTLTKTLKEDLLKAGVEVFFPLSHKKCINKRRNSFEYVEKPLIPGYIFVHTSFEKAKILSREMGLNLWKRHSSYHEDMRADASRSENKGDIFYQKIPDTQIKFFKRAVELYKLDLLLTDVSEINLEQDDEVGIIFGDFQGVRGYLKTTQGKYGGMVIVPVSPDSVQARDSLCFTIEVPADYIGVISFASGKRHASDAIRCAQKLVEKSLKLYAEGQPISEDLKKQLQRYLVRFKNTQFRTEKLRASHLLLLYSIYTMLGNMTLREAVNEEIIQQVLPAFDWRITDARRRGRPDGSDLKAKYLKQKIRVDQAFSAWKQKQDVG